MLEFIRLIMAEASFKRADRKKFNSSNFHRYSWAQYGFKNQHHFNVVPYYIKSNSTHRIYFRELVKELPEQFKDHGSAYVVRKRNVLPGVEL